MRPRSLFRSCLGLLYAVVLTATAAAQEPVCEPSGCSGDVSGAYLCGYKDILVEDGAFCVLNNCQKPRVRQLPAGEQPFQQFLANQQQSNHVRFAVELIVPWNTWANDPDRNPNATPNGTLDLVWYKSGPGYTGPVPPEPWQTVPDTRISLCGDSRHDLLETGILANLSCADLHDGPGEVRYSMRAQVCGGPCPPSHYPNCDSFCGRWTDFALDTAPFFASDINGVCPQTAEVDPCTGEELHGVDPSGDGMARLPAGSGPGAMLRYRAGGVGWPGGPEQTDDTEWQHYSGLPPGWSHDYAMILVSGRESGHTWLVTESGTYRSFWDVDGDGRSDLTFPSDDERYLEEMPDGTRELVEVDGSRHVFSGGAWIGWRDSNGNEKRVSARSADGSQATISMPDGRQEIFTYELPADPGDPKRLASITEVGVDGATTRTWRYGPGLGWIERPDGTRWEFVYGDHGMTKMTLVGLDGSERIEGAWRYDSYGNVTESWKGGETPETGTEAFRFVYDNPRNPRRTTVVDAYDVETVYEFKRDASTNAPRSLEIRGACATCGTNANLRLSYGDGANPLLPTELRDARGTTTRLTYDARGQVVSVVEASNTALARTMTLERQGPFPALVTKVTSPSTSGAGNRVESAEYDPAGNPIVLRAAGVEAGAPFLTTATLTFNDAGLPLSIDPPGHGANDVTTFAYDAARGDLLPLSRTDPLVGTTSFGYDALNRATSTVDPNGAQTSWTYDALDRVIEVRRMGETAFEDRVTTFAYDGLGDLVRITLPEGNLVDYGYDAAGRLTTVERKPDAATPSERALVGYNAAGQPTSIELQRWNGAGWTTEGWTAFRRSSRCRLDQVVHADGSVTEYDYDCNGNLERIWDANHPSENKTAPPSATLIWDELDRLIAIVEPWAPGGTSTTSFAYDVQDHLRQVTDAEGHVTTYAWSDRDLQTREVNEYRGTIRYGYDEAGDLATRTDGRDITAAYLRDALGRLTKIDYPGEDIDTTYEYDLPGIPYSKGRISKIRRGSSVLDYRFDRFGRMIQDGTVGYGYDRNGNQREIRYPNGVVATYGFDYADRPTELVASAPNFGTKTIASGASYYAGGPLRYLALGNGVEEIREFDERYLPTRIEASKGGTPLFDWRYTTDYVGNILSITDEAGSGTTRLFGYQDHAYFLKAATGPWGELAWEYDRIGDRLAEIRNGERSEYGEGVVTVGGEPRKTRTVVPDDGVSLVSWFDAAGNETHQTQGARKVRFDFAADNRLSRIRIDEAGELSQSTAIEYDGRGYLLRAWLNEPASGGEKSRLAATYTTPGTLLHRFETEGHTPTDARDEEDSAEGAYVLYFAGRPVGILQPESSSRRLLYLDTDHLGTPAFAANEQGEQVWGGGLEPFGADLTGASEVGQFLRFPGQWVSRTFEPSGLSYNLNRWYVARLSRYGQQDPLGAVHSIHLVGYANGNPVVYIDPLGLFSVSDWMSEFLVPIAGEIPDIPEWLGNGAAGFGDNLSFGLTNQVREWMGVNHIVNRCSKSYSAGEALGTGLSLAFGAAHLGRNAVYQAGSRGLGRGLLRIVRDPRGWRSVRGTWSLAAGGGKPYLRSAGQSLHHWLVPQRSGLPKSIVNAGFNYLPISAGLNSWMNGGTVARQAVELGLKVEVGAIYGSLLHSSSACECGR